MAIAQGSATLAGAAALANAGTRGPWYHSGAFAGAAGFANAGTSRSWHTSGRFDGQSSLWMPIKVVKTEPRPATAPVNPLPYNPSIYDANPHPGTPNSFVAVTKSDTVPLPPGTVGLWVGGIGDVAVKGVGDSAAVTIASVPAGTFLPGRFSYFMATNTSATAVVAFCVK